LVSIVTAVLVVSVLCLVFPSTRLMGIGGMLIVGLPVLILLLLNPVAFCLLLVMAGALACLFFIHSRSTSHDAIPKLPGQCD